MTGKLWAVVRREYLERVRSKAFVIGTILGPLLMGVVMVLPVLIMERPGKRLRVAVLDAGGGLQEPVEAALGEARRDGELRFDVRPSGEGTVEDREQALREAVLRGEIDGYLLLPRDAVQESVASYYGRTVSNRRDLGLMRWHIGNAVVSHRLTNAGLDPGAVSALTRDVELRTIQLSNDGEREGDELSLLYPITMVLILYTSILMWGQIVMTSIIEEKSSRVIEVVVSGVEAKSLLAGKLVGVGAAGLTQFLVWSLSLLGLSVTARGPLLGGLPSPEVTPLVLGAFIAFFLLGFVFYSALYATVGAAVNTVQEAQNLVFPVIVPLVMGLACFPVVIERPDGALSVVLSLIPFLSPLLMFLRIAILTPSWWQIAVALLLLASSIFAVLSMASRIYRVGILMYGKRPTFAELRRWLQRK